MKLFKAIKASPVQAAARLLTDGTARDGQEPNLVLEDKGRTKAFRATERCAWTRRPLREAKALEDWTPAESRGVPVLPGEETEDVLHPHILPGDDVPLPEEDTT